MTHSIELHHVNIPTHRVDEMGPFYVQILGLRPFAVERVPTSTRSGTVFLEGDAGQLHLAPPDPNLLFGNGQSVNPILRGHVAFRVSDLGPILANLRHANVPFADYGKWAIKGWHQVFFHDPEGNVIEVHQVEE
jgi:catechol 2,3-dioxygenase-like lactoylglutathione lyase family enzyme